MVLSPHGFSGSIKATFSLPPPQAKASHRLASAVIARDIRMICLVMVYLSSIFYLDSIESRFVRVCLPKTIVSPSGDQVRLEIRIFGSFSATNRFGVPPRTGTDHSAV